MTGEREGERGRDCPRRSRVYVQNARMCSFKTPVSHKKRSFSKYTRERFEITHGSFFQCKKERNAHAHTHSQQRHAQPNHNTHNTHNAQHTTTINIPTEGQQQQGALDGGELLVVEDSRCTIHFGRLVTIHMSLFLARVRNNNNNNPTRS